MQLNEDKPDGMINFEARHKFVVFMSSVLSNPITNDNRKTTVESYSQEYGSGMKSVDNGTLDQSRSTTSRSI